MDWLAQYLTVQNKLPHPNWESIYQHVENDPTLIDTNSLWSDIARRWLTELSNNLAEGYSLSESENFIILSKERPGYIDAFSRFLERCLKQLLKVLNGIASDEGFGKHVVIIFDDIDSYYDYITYFGPNEGTSGLSSGMYLNYGYGHFVFPHQELDFVEPLAAHEMTHSLLSQLPIPLWLNEGLAMNMEMLITNMPSPRLNKAMHERHVSFWGETEMQEFWQGKSFSRPDEGQALSYELAQILVSNLSEDYSAFVDFTNKAKWQDGGEQAAEQVFDISLGDMIFNFLGEGDWWPEPETWQQ